MKRCAFLSMDSLDDFVCYDHLLHQPLEVLGWSVDTLSWRTTDTDWNDYEAVIIRSPWDYQQDAGAFLRLLEAIDRSSARLENALSLVRWNIDKRYLRDLEQAGIAIVPTVWGQGDRLPRTATTLFEEAPELVIKPCISANADDTYRIASPSWAETSVRIATRFAGRDWMLQPYMPAIATEGEFSLFYFDGDYSHAVLKTPAQGDFRVQEEHGGRLRSVSPDARLRETGDRVMAGITTLHQCPLYARVDLVRDGSIFRLMEVELIEPSLYFNMDPDSARRFAEAFDARMNRRDARHA